MEEPIPISPEHDGDSAKSSSSAGDGNEVNHSSVDELIQDLNESPPHENLTVKSDINGSGVLVEESNNDNGAEAEHHVERVMADRQIPEEAFDKIKRQETHGLYCPNCICNITTTAELYKKGEEPYPYNTQPLVVWVPLVKLPSISLPWFHNTLAEQVRKFHFKNYLSWLSSIPLRFLLVVVLILFSAILLWSPPSSPQNLYDPFGPPPPDPCDPSPPNPFGPPPPNPCDPSPPNPFGPPPPNPYDPSQTPWYLTLSYVSGVRYFSSVSYISVIALLFLAIPVVFWPSIIVAWDKRNDKNPQIRIKDKETNDPKPHSSSYKDLWERVVPKNLSHLISELDILKSIVYGGLIESITSLGVVSSAAASGASTRNILALGIANLFSGLFLIVHNLNGLITSRPRIQSANNDQMTNEVEEEEDPYENLLGNRKNKNIHCVIVVVSFIFFGVIPPLFYGVSFRRTGKVHYKAAVVLAASLICIISLSFAKACVFKMRKLKTVVEYTGMAIVGSAVSFFVSQFVCDLLEKYDFS